MHPSALTFGFFFHIFKLSIQTGGMVQKLKALAAHAEDPGSVYSITWWLKPPETLFPADMYQVHMWYTDRHTCRQKSHTQKINFLKVLMSSAIS